MPGPPATKPGSARKRDKAAYARKRRTQTVHLGAYIKEWNYIKSKMDCKTDQEVAVLLIDSYNTNEDRKRKRLVASTPCISQSDYLSGWSGVSSIHSLGKMSGIDLLTDTSQSESEQRKVTDPNSFSMAVGHQTCAKVADCMSTAERSPFIRFHETTISEDAGANACDEDDPTYVPSLWDMSLDVSSIDIPREQMVEVNEDLHAEVHDIVVEHDDQPTGLPDMSSLEDVTMEIMEDEMFLVTASCLKALVKGLLIKCQKCDETLEAKQRKNGCGVILTWVCQRGHVCWTWSSQPMLKYGVLLGNFKVASAITLSGNNYSKVALMWKFIGLGLPSMSNFCRIQSHYVVPAVDRFWENVKQTGQEELRATSVVVSGDGRMDSPGHCAKYCTYTMMDQKTKAIVAMEVIDKRECELKSALLEAHGFKRAISELQHRGINVVECVTDAHPQIASIMKKSFPEVRHSWDMWHGAKNFGKKLCAISQERGNSAIKPWISDITNHFFYSAENCQKNEHILKTKFLSVLNHCANRHEWGLGQCDHEEITDDEDRGDKKWLSPCGPEMEALEKVTTDKRFLRTFKYYVTCQTTSELESFNNHILMYASKRQSFTYGVYKCRCQLAAIDYMKHLERPYLKNKKGDQCYCRTFSKATNHWGVKPLKVKKDYLYMKDIMLDIVNDHISRETPLSRPLKPVEGDPILLARTIAPRDPPPTQELVLEQSQRLKLNWGKPATTSDDV